MTELKKCPHCGGQTMLCKQAGAISFYADFSIICLECGMEFKPRYNPQANATFEPVETAKRIIEMFNRREGGE